MTVKEYAKVVGAVALVAYLLISLVVVGRSIESQDRIESMTLRLAALEKSTRARDQADPLVPAECAEPAHSGLSQNAYCQTTVYRLLQAPHQFNGRWVMIEGEYGQGFEESALYAPQDAGPPSSTINYERNAAIWIRPGFSTTPNSVVRKVLVGKFTWGPSGHLSQYFGELSDTVSHR